VVAAKSGMWLIQASKRANNQQLSNEPDS